jgi:hypothetical protein
VITALDLPDSDLNASEREFVSVIREHGWFNTRVFDPEQKEPDFSYSTGFFSSVRFPEIIVFSLPKQVSHDILWDVYRATMDGNAPPKAAKVSGIFGNHQAVLLPVSETAYEEHLGWSRWFYQGHDFPCLQLIWPDREGCFPWEAGFDPQFADKQPDLTEGGWSQFVIE